MKVFGLKATEAQLVLTIMTNMESATKHNDGRMFRTPFDTIHSQFKYNYKRNSTSIM